MNSYAEKLNATKTTYPFAAWRATYHDGLEQYTPENCDAAQRIFDTLITDLIASGGHASEEQKVVLFQKAIEATNELPEDVVETGEREQLTTTITLAYGLQPEKYGDGLASGASSFPSGSQTPAAGPQTCRGSWL